jgi:hypothetical protein
MRHGWWSVCSRPWLFLLLVSYLVHARAFQPLTRKDRIGQRQPSHLVYENRRDESDEPFFLSSSSQTTAGRSSERHCSTTEEDDDPLHGPRSRCCCLWLKLSYDGRRFDGGWDNFENEIDSSSTNGPSPIIIKTTIRKRTRAANRRRLRRSVKSEIQTNLARLYGNIAPSQIVVRSTVPSLDPGVYAVGLVVQVAGLVADETTTKQLQERKKQKSDLMSSSSSSAEIEIGGVEEDVASTSSYRTSSRKDTTVMLLPLPTPPHRMCIALNRLLDDVQVKAYSITGCCSSSMNGLPHDDHHHPWVPPSPRVVVKTYAYRLSFGPRPDPIQRHQVWHINCDSTTDPPSTILGRLQAASDRCRLAEPEHNGAWLDGDSRVVVSRPDGDETDWHGTWRYDVTVTTTGGGRNCATDRAVRSHVAEIVQDVFGNVASVNDDDTSTLRPPPATTTTAITMAPAHGLVLVNVQCSDNDDNYEDLVWHAAHRYVLRLLDCSDFRSNDRPNGTYHAYAQAS